MKNEESENAESECQEFDLMFGLSLLLVLQFWVTHIGKMIQISYHFSVDLFASSLWKCWQRIYIQVFI